MTNPTVDAMNASDWMKGIFFSVLASWVGAASKLAIRKSWLMEEDRRRLQQEEHVFQQQASQSSYSNPNEPLPAEPQLHIGDDNEDGIHVPAHSHSRKPNSRRQLLNRNKVYTAIAPHSDDNHHGNNSNDNHNYPTEDEEDLPAQDEIQSTAASVVSTTRHYCCLSLPRLLRFAGMIGMTFLNPLFCVLAMNYASPSILAPFSGLTLVWVVVLSKPLIDEYPTCSQKVASFLIVVGEVMVAVFGDHTNDEDSTVQSIFKSYQEPAFVAYFIGIACFMVLSYLLIQCASPTLRRFAWGTSGGAMTGLAQCFIKDALEVLKATPGGLFHMPLFNYFFGFNAILWSFVGLILLTQAMKRYDATYSAATFVGSFVVSASIMSAAHYHTFQHLAGVIDLVMYPLGLIILMMGVAILVQRGTQQDATNVDETGNGIYHNPRENRSYSDAFLSSDVPDENDTTPVIVIPEVIHETTVTERQKGNAENGKPRFTGDEMELVRKCCNAL